MTAEDEGENKDRYEGYLADAAGELDQRAVWRAAEEYLCAKYNLVPEHSSWYDARTQEGEPVEIKSCQARYADGRIGRFKIWQKQDLKLGTYGQFAVLVYLPKERYPVLASRKLRSYEMNDWESREVNHPTMGSVVNGIEFLQLHPWPTVIPPDELSTDIKHRFLGCGWWTESTGDD